MIGNPRQWSIVSNSIVSNEEVSGELHIEKPTRTAMPTFDDEVIADGDL
jgi:hypothetical protein